MPTRDRLHFLRKSLPAALGQSYEPYEVVISDNWSADGTRELCLEAARADPRVRYVRPPRPVGHYANHNVAFREARGRYISFFHDDDLYRPQLLARFVAFLEDHPSVGVVSSDWDRIDENDRALSPRIHHRPAVSPGMDYIESTLRSGRSVIALPCCMIRREALPEPPFDEREPSAGFTDHVTWLLIAERWDIGHVPERLFAYRQHSGAGSSKPIRTIVEEYTNTFTAFVEDHLRRFPDDAVRARRWSREIQRYRSLALAYDALSRLPAAGWLVGRSVDLVRRILRIE